MYTENDQPSKALEVLEDGLAANPNSATLHIYAASLHMERGDFGQAETLLSKAERIDPESLLVRSYRHVLNLSKPKQAQITSKSNKYLKQKKKKRYFPSD